MDTLAHHQNRKAKALCYHINVRFTKRINDEKDLKKSLSAAEDYFFALLLRAME